MADNAKTLGKTIATSVPEDKDAVSGWLQNLSNAYPGYYFCYFEGMPDEEGFHVVGGEPNLAAYWEQHQMSQTLQRESNLSLILRFLRCRDRQK